MLPLLHFQSFLVCHRYLISFRNSPPTQSNFFLFPETYMETHFFAADYDSS